MTHSPLTLASLGLAFTIATTPPGDAQEKTAKGAPPRVQLSDDLARDAMRREAEAAMKAREQQFARLRDLPPAPVQQVRIMPGGRVGRLLILQEPVRLRLLEADGPVDPRFIVASESFDQVVFGSTGDASTGRAHAHSRLDQLIDQVDQTRRLTPAQKQKLLLAGRGDIKRLFDTIEDKRQEFELLRSDLDRCEQFLNDLLPLRRRLVYGPFEAESLVRKTLAKIANEEKLARRQMALDDRAQAGP
jgi:hypothetical protein